MMDTAQENDYDYTDTYLSFPNVSKNYDYIPFEDKFLLGSTIALLVISIFGAVGNGVVIWLLGFRIKRNPFSIFILNLAVADLGFVLLAIVYSFIYLLDLVRLSTAVLVYLDLLMYTISQFLRMVISIDRCVAIFCPLWYQCKRPLHWSIIVCALIWVLSALLTGITYTLHSVNPYHVGIEHYYQFIVNAMLCLPVMIIATVALSMKACLKAAQHRRGRPLTIVLLSLPFYFLFGFPLNVICILTYLHYVPGYLFWGAYILACLNSSVNPVIYFLVGRQWKTRPKESMKMILQNVFKEEESCEEETPV